jgi:hypothetical protein
MPREPQRMAGLAIDELQERLLRALEGLRFGAVEIQVHDFRVVRITRTEQVRLETEEKHRR